MADALHAYDEMSVGRVFARGFGVIAHNPLTVFIIGFVGVAPTMTADWYVQVWRMEFDQRTHLLGFLGVTLGSALVALIVQVIVAGALVCATMANARGERATIGECAQTSLSVALPLVGLSLLEGIAVVFGMIFLLVPGIILYLMWAVAAPSLVAERVGVTEALARSTKLTEGARWKIFGIEAILIVGASAFGGAMGGRRMRRPAQARR